MNAHASGIRIRTADATEVELFASIDDDAARLFAQAGLDVDFPPDHPFVMHERSRWSTARTTLLALDGQDEPVGFAMLGHLDGEAYLEQISVRIAATRRGIGTRLLESASAAAREAGERAILLTTWAHLQWNRPFYERNGYAVLCDAACGTGIARELEIQRRWLPQPELRIAMRKPLHGP